MTDLNFDVLLDEAELQSRVAKLAEELAPKLKGEGEDDPDGGETAPLVAGHAL